MCLAGLPTDAPRGHDVATRASDSEGSCQDVAELGRIRGGIGGDEVAIGASTAGPLGVSAALVVALEVRAVECV